MLDKMYNVIGEKRYEFVRDNVKGPSYVLLSTEDWYQLVNELTIRTYGNPVQFMGMTILVDKQRADGDPECLSEVDGRKAMDGGAISPWPAAE